MPPTLYKVLPAEYARRMVSDGELMCSTLTWFQNVEDTGRVDVCEGERRYFPINGLSLTRLQRAGLPDNANVVLPKHGMVSRAAQSHHIFIYSLTMNPFLQLGDSAERACVRIFDTQRFIERFRDAVARHKRARLSTLIYNSVQYWSTARPPEEVWALPDKLVMHKRDEPEFCEQREFRVAFGTRADVYDFENVECFVVNKDTRWPRPPLDPQAHRMRLRLGALSDCCSVETR